MGHLREHLLLALILPLPPHGRNNRNFWPDPGCFPGRNLQFRVVAGDHNLYEKEGSEQVFSLSKIIIHPRWNSEDVSEG